MPHHMPDESSRKAPRVKVAAAQEQGAESPVRKPQAAHAVEKFDWLALWSLSIAFSALFMAGVVYFNEGDTVGASIILAGAAGIVALVLLFSEAPGERN